MMQGNPVREHRGGAGGGDVFVQASLLFWFAKCYALLTTARSRRKDVSQAGIHT